MTSQPDLSQLNPDDELQRNMRMGMRVVVPQQDTGARGPVIAPPSVSPGVNLPPVGAQPNKIAQDESQLEHFNNAPRFLGSQSGIASLKPQSTIGKVGKGILGGLDIIGSIAAPGLMARIPGTSMHHNLLESEAAGNVASDVAQEQKQAETREENAAAAEKENAQPAAAATTNTAEGVKQWDPDTNRYDIPVGGAPAPKGGLQHILTDQGYVTIHPDGSITPLTVNGKPLMGPPKTAPQVPGRDVPFPADVEQQRQQEEQRKAQAQQDSQNRAFAHQDKMSEQRMAQQEKAQADRENQLTSTTKSMVEAAPKVLQLASRINTLIDQQAKQLGPASSRWAEFMAGKVGAPNTQFTQLRTDVGLLTTLLMRMHVGARGGEYIMKHFQDLIDSGKQSPENLKAALGEIVQYANDVESEGRQGGMKLPEAGASTGGPTPGTVENGYRFKGGNPADQNSWDKVK